MKKAGSKGGHIGTPETRGQYLKKLFADKANLTKQVKIKSFLEGHFESLEGGNVRHSISESKISRIFTGIDDLDNALAEIIFDALGLSEPERTDARAKLKRLPLREESEAQVNKKREMVVHCDLHAVEKLVEEHPGDTWFGRLKWAGFHGGSKWFTVLRDYPQEEVVSQVSPVVASLLRNMDESVFVSLGPGDGDLDKAILEEVEKPMTYIPVDIGMSLLVRTWSKVSDLDNARLSIAIVGEFEEGFKFIAEKIRDTAKGVPAIYCLLGNTLANLERNESKFLRQVVRHLSPLDRLILHVTTCDENYSAEDDRLFKPLASADINESRAFKDFLTFPITRADRGRRTGESALQELWDQVVVSTDWTSDVAKFAKKQMDRPTPLTKSFCVKHQGRLLMGMTRYDVEELEAFLDDVGLKTVETITCDGLLFATAAGATVRNTVLLLEKSTS